MAVLDGWFKDLEMGSDWETWDPFVCPGLASLLIVLASSSVKSREQGSKKHGARKGWLDGPHGGMNLSPKSGETWKSGQTAGSKASGDIPWNIWCRESKEPMKDFNLGCQLQSSQYFSRQVIYLVNWQQHHDVTLRLD